MKMEWVTINEKDKLMNGIVCAVYAIFEKDQSNGQNYEHMKDDLASTFAAADYLAEMKPDDFGEISTKTIAFRKIYKITSNS